MAGRQDYKDFESLNMCHLDFFDILAGKLHFKEEKLSTTS
jgi:hypothetical protein